MPIKRSKRLLLLVAVATTLALSVFVSLSMADGGSHPSAAPLLPLGQHVTGGASNVDTYSLCCSFWRHPDLPGVQYWRLPLTLGDKVTLDYEVVTGSDTGICLLAPSVNDYTVGDSDCALREQMDATHPGQKAEATFIAPTSGKWTLAVGDDSCCNNEAWAYDIRVKLRHRTVLDAHAPNSGVASGHAFTLSGQISPAVSGILAVRERFNGHLSTVGRPKIGATGHFAIQVRVPQPGRYRFFFQYSGNAQYLPSRAKLSVSAR